jgi:hypothetical protein
MTKEILFEQVDKLPHEFSLDELMEQLILVEKINKGISQSKKNEVFTEEELELRISKWSA